VNTKGVFIFMQTEQWKSLGNRVKEVESELSRILMDSQLLIKNKKDLSKLLKAIANFRDFKSDADSVMVWNSRPISDKDWEEIKSVFYG